MKHISADKNYINQIKYIFVFSFLLIVNTHFTQTKNPVVVQADLNFKNEAYFDAIDLYKKGEVKEKDIQEKGRINFQIAECYRLDVEPAQAETYYKRAFKLKYQKNHPKLYILLADVLVEEGEYESAAENIREFLKIYPEDSHAKKLLSSCEHHAEWVRNGTKHKIQNERQINSKHYDYSPAWGDIDHNTVIFVSARDGSNGDGIDSRTGDSYMDLWSSNRDNLGKWSEPQLLPNTINSKDNEGPSVLSPEGDEIYFTRCPRMKKVDLGCEIFYSKRKGDSWTQAKKINLKPEGGDTLSCGHPAMDSEMKILIFSADFPGGFGAHDLWMSQYDEREESWMSPVNLGSSINTEGDEMFPYLSDNGDLYFSSDGYEGFGSLDMFKALSLGQNKWGDVENLGYPLNSPEHDFGIILERNTDRRGMFTSSREGTRGHDDLFNFNLPPFKLRGMAEVLDEETLEPIPGVTITLTETDSLGAVTAEYVQTTDIDGMFNFDKIDENQNYILEDRYYICIAQKDSSYLIGKQTAETFNAEEEANGKPGAIVPFPFRLKKIDPEKPMDFPEVQYALDKAELLVNNEINSKDSLDFLYDLLNDNPSIVIELQAHTDCRGGDDYNLKLSQRRAESCVNYLVSKGIPSERMKAVGYGESIPRNEKLECNAISKLSTKEEQEAAHQKNRRTQFIVLNTDYVSKDK
ncbi:MAG: OmpA family protein [Flavobacteriales bacterium]|nr:OmpA family protein [Flavobacteriales bacterium]